jgi:hypothetical protein
VFHRAGPWDPEQWPIPVFIVDGVLTGRRLETYHDDDLLTEVRLPKDTPLTNSPQVVAGDLLGWGLVEERAQNLIEPR